MADHYDDEIEINSVEEEKRQDINDKVLIKTIINH